ncbi:MAG: UvrD-helicase domain-containing protein [Micromonosporaceae bacterium]
MKPTGEQAEIVAAFGTVRNLVIEAGAGTGKTSTLRMLAAAAPKSRGIYVAYNRAIADDAKKTFPRSVRCATAHGLAFQAIGKRYGHRLRGPRVPARDTARVLRIREPVKLDSGLILAPQQVARIVMETVGRFCHSADPEPRAWHVPVKPGIVPGDMAALTAEVLPLAGRAWVDIASVDGQLRFSHDCYLKMWQLSRPTLPADYVLLDEAQDANPVVADIIESQHGAKRVLVGDRCQAIYGWRGAIDAMGRFAAEAHLHLSQSFRFGAAVAAEANKWLSVLDSPLRLRGYDRINSVVEPAAAAAAVLCRTNAEAVSEVMDVMDDGQRAALVGGGGAIKRLAQAAITLKAGLGTDHPELFAFRTWGELQEYVEHDAAGADLKVFVRLVDTHGPDVIIATMDQLSDESSADVVVSTAHKAKGREWDSVRIAGDFQEPKQPENEPRPKIPDAEAMLAYVAVTRARLTLDRTGLSWVDSWLPGVAR